MWSRMSRCGRGDEKLRPFKEVVDRIVGAVGCASETCMVP